MAGPMLGLVLVVAGCGSPSTPEGQTSATPPTPATEPDDAVRIFLQAAADGDCEAVRDMAATPSELDCTVVDGFAYLLEGADPDDVTMDVSDETDQSAVVTLDLASGPSELSVRAIGGEWKVVVDSAA